MNTIVSNEGSQTHICEKFYNRFKDGFGDIVKAKMEGCSGPIYYKLTLTNDKGKR